MRILAILAGAVLLSSCAQIPVERTYSLGLTDSEGREANAGVTLKPPPPPTVLPAPAK